MTRYEVLWVVAIVVGTANAQESCDLCAGLLKDGTLLRTNFVNDQDKKISFEYSLCQYSEDEFKRFKETSIGENILRALSFDFGGNDQDQYRRVRSRCEQIKDNSSIKQ